MKFVTLGAVLTMAATLSFGETFTGKLVDASCAAKAKNADCAATVSTKSFAIQTADGKVLKLDSSGNSKAMAAMKGDFKPDSTVTVNGELSGQTVKVDSIDTK